MGQICKGICERLKPNSMPNNLRYKSGQKRCGLYNCFLEYEGAFCPCCKTRLRSKPRSKKVWNQL
ncbi:hypothetical protein C5F50_03470 [Nitrosopumilus ureiphilus]|uniref:Uncharacterized protein n=1 Tax=Nitrosopumilus ureiphilus TaxID=1470067 RepID=A0A7D5R2G0_9ARCH|nr:hypothetical protein C5F50_03470 [Nitrosopumilus ureiphilus]